MSVRFFLNGEPVRVDEVDPHVTLLAWLRQRGLTGSKEGCAEGECGACAVALLACGPGGEPRYDAINACLLPLPSLEGRAVWSVEGVAEDSGRLHPVQRAMVERGGSQCGYCTPGFVVSLFCEYYRPGRDAPDPEAISGNLCRCTGYRPILDVLAALPAVASNDPKRPLTKLPLLAQATASELEHDSGARRFLRPRTLEQALDALERFPGATPIAGGTDLMVNANQRYERYDTLIALEAVEELRRFELLPSELVLGAALTLSELEARLHGAARELPLFGQLWPLFSSRLIRNRATLGGNLGTASPIADLPPVLLALDAELSLVSRAGTRRLSLSEFFIDYRATARRPDELIAAVHVPRPVPALQRFYKVSKRVLDDISIVAAAFTLDLDAAGTIRRLRAAFGGLAATPIRALETESLALGRPWTRDTLELLSKSLLGLGTPLTDHRGSAAYRAALPGKLLQKFFVESAEHTQVTG